MNTLKLILFLIVFRSALFHNTSNAQSVKFGLKGGFNSSGVSSTTYGKTESKTGFNVYLFADFLNDKVFSVTGEAGYTQKGFEYHYDYYNEKLVFTGREVANANLDYVDFSVLGKLKVSGKKIVPYILAGPSFGIKVRDQVSAPHNDGYGDLAFLLVEFENTTLGMKFGVGSELNVIPNISIVLEARYNTDLSISYQPSDFRIAVGSWTNNSYDLRNQVFEFMAGVKF